MPKTLYQTSDFWEGALTLSLSEAARLAGISPRTARRAALRATSRT